MKKAFRIIGICALVLCILFFALCLLAPRIAKGYVESHSKELVGRRVQIESVSFNPFRFSVSVKGFAVFEKDDSTTFASFREFYVNADPLRLLTGNISLSEVRLDSPFARIQKDGEVFNFSDILGRFASDSANASAEKKDSAQTNSLPFGISIRQIAILSGNILYDDNEVNSHIGIRDFSLRIPEVYFSNRKTSLGVNLEFADGGALHVESDYAMESGDFAVNVALSKFSLSAVKPYLETALNFKELSGTVDVALSLSGNANDVLSSVARGRVSLDSVLLTENSGKTMGVESLEIQIAEANLKENRFVVDSVSVRGADAHFDLFRNSNNIEALLSKKKAGEKSDSAIAAKSPAADSAKPAKLDLLVKNFSVADTRFALEDHTVPGGFRYVVSGISVGGISVGASNVALDREANVDVRASLPHGGSVKAFAKFNPADANRLSANVSVKNVSMKDFSVYSEYYTGYPITAGAFGFASDNLIRDGEIDSRNNIDIYNLTVGDKPSGAKPEYTVPMKIALYILKDKDGKIAFDVPVKGNLRDPKFSYGKIIWQTVMNLMVKVALSPAKFLFGGSAPSDFPFDIAADDFTSEQYGIASDWTRVLSERPGAILTIVEAFRPEEELEAFALAEEKLDFYRQGTGRSELTPVDRKAALEVDVADDAFKAFDATWSRPSDAELRARMEKLSALRREKLLKALSAQAGVTAKNLAVRKATAKEMAALGKKSLYRMVVEFP